MTTPNTNNRWVANGDGSNKNFGYDNWIQSASHLQVWVYDTVALTNTLQVITTDYSVTGVGNTNGGDVVFVTAPTSDQKVTILRKMPYLQQASLPAVGPMPNKTVEEQLDYMVALTVQLLDEAGRMLRLDESDSQLTLAALPLLSTAVAGQLLTLKSDKTGFEFKSASDIDITAVSAFVATLLPAATAAAFMTTLGLSANGQSLVTAANYAAMRTLLGLVIGTDVQAYDADIMKTDVAQVMTKGIADTVHDLGTVTTGTVTLDYANGNQQKLTANGAFTLAPQVTDSTIRFLLTNGASAGTITLTGWTHQEGDPYETTNGVKFLGIAAVQDGGANSHLKLIKQA